MSAAQVITLQAMTVIAVLKCFLNNNAVRIAVLVITKKL